MRYRNFFMGFVAVVVVMLVLLSSRTATTSRSATPPATTPATSAVDPGAACEALRANGVATKPAATQAVAAAGTEEAAPEIPRPSNPGGPGPALKLKGDMKAGAKVFVDNCEKCHAPQGTGGVKNPGSTDGTIPPLNPIDEMLVDKDLNVFACNIDLFVEHGSTPEGEKPQEVMAAWGDEQKLTPQQIADVIAYVVSLNGASAEATAAPTSAK